MEAPLALYRRYRPETFAEVIGQDHVTEPLRAALANNRVNHAYLFSGPRGCGKTTSARILARALNCEQAPVADPCGECDSCRDLARGGPGSIDVIEIDAASHGGVDDARDLREKAFFAPVRSRYKVYIIDEAHMVSTQGFNALLKLVEEPPEHLRFIFATTEPDKVLPTIRSRTHHYPFRLIPPRLLTGYLGELCAKESVAIEPAALPLVVRAGGGSARDTLSVLDQLLGGAGADGVTHTLATGLLGYTPESLLDEVVDAFAAGDGAAVFGVVDKVVETGQDPRRFTEDLLRRLRDLVIVAAVPDAPASGLIDVAEDAGERLVAQAARFGVHDLSRAADLVATGLTEMRGATAPRLLLELICARVLLPGADDSREGLLARLDRLERRFAITGEPAAAAPHPPAPSPARAAAPAPTASPAPAASAPAPPPPASSPGSPAPAPAAPASPAAAPAPAEPESLYVSQVDTPSEPAERRETTEPPAQTAAEQTGEPAHPAQTAAEQTGEPAEAAAESPTARSAPEPDTGAAQQPAPEPEPTPAPQQSEAEPAGLSLVDVRRLWPDIVEATKLKRRVTWIHLTQNAQVVAVDAGTLTLGFANAGARESFVNGGSPEIVRQAAIDVVGADWRVDAIVDPGARSDLPAPPAQGAGATPAGPAQVDQGTGPDPSGQAAHQGHQGQQGPQGQQGQEGQEGQEGTGTPAGHARQPAEGTEPDRPEAQAAPGPDASGAARGAIQQTRSAGSPPAVDPRAADGDAHPDDPDAEGAGLAGAELLQRELGAQIIQEIKHD
ncbi:DNA polymerase III subunit gamma and tau [Nocardioides donggukensis]|uniref:DNA polymerase III subunit gamma/tau n=1 Tax=Nocardioides donggukensis TaxID=2774019 RepID=A0A927PZZ6_9ACTN|nr:DNA polymerase III subunit gamma and tau [Nocardioides donggukensis]MBD8870973.1 DNA polymerase III subunit gamma and tau [Nocardioides donggukensis]